MLWFVVIAGIVTGAYFWMQARRRARAAHDFMTMTERVQTLRKTKASACTPDLQFAAKGYMQIAITRRNAPHLDLHKLERAFAEELLSEGCTKEQALSARWGGAYAIADDVASFDDALAAYKETAAEFGRQPFANKQEAEKAYLASALLVIGTAHATDPAEYGRFLKFIGA